MHKFSLTTTCLVDAPELCWIFGDSTFRIFWNYILGRSGFRCWTSASTQWISMVEVRFRTELLTAEQGRPLSCNKKPIHLGADSGYNRRFHLVSIDSVGALGKVGLDALPSCVLSKLRLSEPCHRRWTNCRPGSFLVMQGCQSCGGWCEIWTELKVNELSNDMHIYSSLLVQNLLISHSFFFSLEGLAGPLLGNSLFTKVNLLNFRILQNWFLSDFDSWLLLARMWNTSRSCVCLFNTNYIDMVEYES